MSGTKYDGGKNRVDLLDSLALEGLAQVLTFGATKYAAHNWRGGISYSRLISSLLRHLFAIQRGEDIDPESGLPHIDHVGCNWMFLSNFTKTRPDLDDRWKDLKNDRLNYYIPDPVSDGNTDRFAGCIRQFMVHGGVQTKPNLVTDDGYDPHIASSIVSLECPTNGLVYGSYSQSVVDELDDVISNDSTTSRIVNENAK